MEQPTVAELGPVTPDERLSSNVRAAATARGVTLVELARRIGVPRQKLYRRLDGTAPWTYAELLKVAGALGVPLADLTRETDRQENRP